MTKTKAPRLKGAKPDPKQTEKMSELLLGKTIVQLEGAFTGSKLVVFHLDDGVRVRMRPDENWDTSISLEDVAGDIEDLIGTVTLSEVIINDQSNRHGKEAWTFYRLATKAGLVVFRWYGVAGAYYSVDVNIELDQTIWYEVVIFDNGILLEGERERKALAHFKAFDVLPEETFYFQKSNILFAHDINWTDFEEQ